MTTEEKNKSREYIAGYDAGFNSPNTSNCHLSYFSTPEKTKEWERGNKDGKAQKEIVKQPKEITP